MTEHELKCWPEFYDAIEDGRKTFEARRNDRGYQTGDVLVLQRTCESHHNRHIVDRDLQGRVRRQLRARVTYILHGGTFGVQDGWCVMSIAREDAQP